MKRKTINGDEVDAFAKKHHHHHNWAAGQRKAIKTGASRRDRRQARREIRLEHAA